MYKDNIIESIRILPNDKGTFSTEEDFKAFIVKQLIERDGYYYFPSQMMRCPDNTLVLFQYSGKIMAIGILIESKKIQSFDEEGNEYSGYYRFDINSIYMLDNPMSKEELQTIHPEFKNFNQSKQFIPMEYLDNILMALKKKIF